MSTIKAPFNFVPLSDKVYFPNWADQISQDIPFSDGVSGSIELKITAETPIFVRNGHSQEDAIANNDRYKSFSKTPGGQYFIPATSIKGAIRSVLEIISSSKIGIINNQSFGIRDLSTSTDGNFYREKMKPENIHCGWLSLSGNKYYINDCGLPWRISAEEIDRILGIGLNDFVINGDFQKDDNRTAQAKYNLSEGISLCNTFSPDDELRKALKAGNRLFVRFDKEGDLGTIVFTGQPGSRKKGNRTNKKGDRKWEGKYFEFVFPQKTDKNLLEIPETTYSEFVSIHKESPDYLYLWKKKLQEGGEIPVFFILSPNNSIEAIGLSYMFKFPAYNSIFKAIRQDDLIRDRMDLAECIFGHISNQNAIKGRVQFCHAICTTTNPVVLKESSLTLSSPNPSYYPLYLGNGQTWNSESIHIAGRKRYPTRNHIYQSSVGKAEMQSYLVPLDKATSFSETIRFHNLKPIELGAIISAITFDDNHDCRHNIGSGKPFGYGKIKVEIVSVKTTDKEQSKKYYLDLFHEELRDYLNQEAIQELQKMAIGIPSEKEPEFSYMHMDTNREANEFLIGKKEYATGEQLGLFSEILSGVVPKASFIGNVAANKQRENMEAILLMQQERKDAYNNIISDAKEAIQNGNFFSAREHLNSARAFSASYVEIDRLMDEIDEKENSIKQKEIEDAKKAAEEEQRVRVQAKIESGLSCLDEKYEFDVNEGRYKVDNFKGMKNRVLDWMKKSNNHIIPEDQEIFLKNTLARIYASFTKDRDKKLWLKPNEGIWKDVESWIGKEKAMELFDEIIK